MRKVAASFMAMATGWGLLNLAVVVFVVVEQRGVAGVFDATAFWAIATGIVIAVAWLFVYLPVYALVRGTSGFWRWGVCVPSGFLIGAIVPFGLIAAAERTFWDSGALMAMGMAGMVGGVAAVVGRWLFPWSRHYENQARSGNFAAGKRIPWLRV